MKRTLYPKLLGGYLIYGLICFIIISTFGYHITFNFLERRDASTLYRESALISSNYAENYFKRSTTLEEMKTQLSTLSTYLSSEIWIIDKDTLPQTARRLSDLWTDLLYYYFNLWLPHYV